MATIPYANVASWKPLPIDAQDVVTEARIVIAGEYQGVPLVREATKATTGAGVVSWGQVFPWPVVHQRIPDVTDNNTYLAARAAKLPATDYNPFKGPGSDSVGADNVNSTVNVTDEADARDGDSGTYAVNTAAGITTINYIYRDDGVNATTIDRAYGARLLYEYVTDAPLSTDRLQVEILPILDAVPRDSTEYQPLYVASLPPTDSPQEMWMVTPFDGRSADINMVTPAELQGYSVKIQVNANPQGTGQLLRVYHLHGLVLDTDRLDGLGDAQIKVPAAAPKRIEVDYHVPMEASHTITGWPGGDLDIAPARQTYQDGKTVIEVEQLGGRLGISALERNEAEALRRETFGITMGSRRG